MSFIGLFMYQRSSLICFVMNFHNSHLVSINLVIDAPGNEFHELKNISLHLFHLFVKNGDCHYLKLPVSVPGCRVREIAGDSAGSPRCLVQSSPQANKAR